MPWIKPLTLLIFWVITQPSQAQQDSVKLSDVHITFRLLQAEPIGGIKAYFKNIQQNLRYPPQARKNNVEGKVFIRFIVRKSGTLTNVEVIKGLGYGCDKEALRLVKTTGKWKAGRNIRDEVIAQRRIRISSKKG